MTSKTSTQEKTLNVSFLLGLSAVAVLSLIPMALSEKAVRQERRLATLTSAIAEERYTVSRIKTNLGIVYGLYDEEPDVAQFVKAKTRSNLQNLQQKYEQLKGSLTNSSPSILGFGNTSRKQFFIELDRDVEEFAEQVNGLLERPYRRDDATNGLILQTIEALDASLMQRLQQLEDELKYRQEVSLLDYQLIQQISVGVMLIVLMMVWFLLFRPLVKRIKAERENLVRTLAEKEAANEAKTEFISNMSHEIRTPLAAISGFTEMIIASDEARESTLKLARSIRRNSKHLDHLLGDVLDLSKVETGNLVVVKEIFDFHVLIQSLYNSFAVEAEKQRLDLVFEYLNPVPDRIYADEKGVRQVLTNLISNAIKFTSEGEVRVCIGVQIIEDEAHIVCHVKDTGIGISKKDQKKLFRRFFRSDTSLTREKSGTGIGLTISAHLAEAMQGRLRLASSGPVGSEFEFRFPIRPIGSVRREAFVIDQASAKDEEGFANQDALQGMTVLLVEDGEDNRYVLNYFLKRAGATVINAENGQEGVEICVKLSQRIDLILMDIQMPVLDGYQATVKLRELGYSIPIIALTAHAMKDEKGKCLAIGFDDYLSKPVEVDDLLRMIRGQLDRDFEKPGQLVSPVTEGENVEKASDDEVILSKYHEKPTFHPVIIQFGSNILKRMKELEAALDQEDMDQVAKLSHKFKGAASTYGYMSVANKMQELEEIAKTDGDLKKARDCFLVISSMARSVREGAMILEKRR